MDKQRKQVDSTNNTQNEQNLIIDQTVNTQSPQLSKSFSDLQRRFVSAVIMLSIFGFSIQGGPIYCSFFIVFLCSGILIEVLPMKLRKSISLELKILYYFLVFYILFIFIFYFSFTVILKDLTYPDLNIIHFLMNNASMILFLYLFIGLSTCVVLLEEKYLKFFYSSVCYISFVSITTLFFSSLIISNIYTGIYWLLAPVLLVIFGEWGGYFGGRFFGRTQMSFLSPKKTYEGYITGIVISPIVSFIVSIFNNLDV